MTHVLLTGATGFLGSHLLKTLLAEGYKVTVLKRSTSDTWRIDHLLKQVAAHNVDQVAIEEAFQAEKINAVIHTACNYGRSGEKVDEIVGTNVVFGLKILESAINFGADAFFNTDTLLPKYVNAYSLSKRHFTEWLKLRSHEIRVVNLKLEHMYGPRDDRAKFVPWLINQLEKGVERIALTEGHQKRDFIYVDDVVSAYMLTLQKNAQLSSFSEFDVGTGRLTSIYDFVTAIYETYQKINPGSATELGFGDVTMRQGEMMEVDVDNSALKGLGWDVKTLQADGLKKLFEVSK